LAVLKYFDNIIQCTLELLLNITVLTANEGNREKEDIKCIRKENQIKRYL